MEGKLFAKALLWTFVLLETASVSHKYYLFRNAMNNAMKTDRNSTSRVRDTLGLDQGDMESFPALGDALGDVSSLLPLNDAVDGTALVLPRIESLQQTSVLMYRALMSFKEMLIAEREQRKKDNEDVMNRTRMIGDMVAALFIPPDKDGKSSKSLFIDGYIRAQAKSVDKVLPKTLMEKACAFCVTEFLVSWVDQKPLSKEVLLDLMAVLCFAPSSSERTEQVRTTIGTVFTKLRYNLLWSFITNAIAFSKKKEASNPPETFLESATGNPSENGSLPFVSPMWARRAIITEEQALAFTNLKMGVSKGPAEKSDGPIADTVDDEENSVDEHREVRSRKRKRQASTPSRQEKLDTDVSEAVLKYIWLETTKWLTQSRYNGRIHATKAFGFLMEAGAEAKWTYTFPSEYLEKMGLIPDAQTTSNSISPVEANHRNDALVDDLGGLFPLLELKVTYVVTVYGDAARNESTADREKRPLIRRVNLIDAALDYLREYYRTQNTWEVVRASRHSLRMVFLVAMAMARALEEATRVLQDGGSLKKAAQVLIDAEFLVEGMSKRLEIIHSELHMDISRYEMLTRKNHGTANEGGTAEEEVDTTNEGANGSVFPNPFAMAIHELS